jgi:hypothetical protein
MRSMLEQKKTATRYFPRFSYSVDGKVYSPPEDLASKLSTLETELVSAKKEAEKAQDKATDSGGLIGALANMDAETKKLAVTQLSYQLIALRNGFPPYIELASDQGTKLQATPPATDSAGKTESKTTETQTNEKIEDCQIPGTMDFRKTTWGMSKSQVKATEVGPPDERDDVLSYSIEIAGMRCFLVYIFVEDKLVRAKYRFAAEHSNKNDYIEDYLDLKKTLEKKYGELKEDDVLWKDNLYRKDSSERGFAVSLGHLSYYSEWDTENTAILLFLTGENYTIKLGIEYSSKVLKNLENKTREKEQASEL